MYDEETGGHNMFQSTHSLRSATKYDGLTLVLYIVSIHALLAECDRMMSMPHSTNSWFQSTHSLRSATVHFKDYCVPLWVSIHALLAECDFFAYQR